MWCIPNKCGMLLTMFHNCIDIVCVVCAHVKYVYVWTHTRCRELMTRVRGQDVQLLKAVGVDLICDLMVEKKKSKYGLL